MQFDIQTAQAIAQLAASLGLPVSAEEDLILALTSVDLIESSDEEAEKIWKDAQLPVEALSLLQDEDAVAWISTEILPAVKSYVNGKAQHTSIPYGYPLSDELLQQIYPKMSLGSIQLIAAGWETQRWNAIKYLALCEIWKLVDSTKPEYANKGENFCKNGSIYLNGFLSALEDSIKDIPDNTARGSFGTLIIRLNKNKNRI